MSEEPNSFVFQNSCYRGQQKIENIIFNDKLQIFSQKVSYICSLETAGKLTAEESFAQIDRLWQDLTQVADRIGLCDRIGERT